LKGGFYGNGSNSKTYRKKRTTYAVKYYDPETGNKRHHKSFKTYADAKSAETDLRLMLEKGKMTDTQPRKKIKERSFSLVWFGTKNQKRAYRPNL